MRKIYTLFFLILSLSLYSVELKKEQWVVEWGELEAVNLSTRNQHLAVSIPSYFINNIDKTLQHYPTTHERTRVIEELKQKKKVELLSEKTKILKQRDMILFDNLSDDKIKKVEDEIEKNSNSFKDLENLKVSDLKEFEIKYQPEDIEKLEVKRDFEIDYYMERNSIDYYITGVLEEDFDNLFLTILLYSKYTTEPVVIWKGLGSSEDILNFRETILEKLCSYIISKDIITYIIKVEQSDALIYVNNEFKTLGFYKGIYIGSDPVNIRIQKEGYESITSNNFISKNNNQLDFSLKALQNGNVTITSDPNGALVYYGSKYLGVTPLEVPLYTYAQKLTLSYDGYRDKSIVLTNGSRDRNIKLSKKVMESSEYFALQKKNFYASSAIFSFSLALPIFINSQGDLGNEVLYNIAIGNAVLWGVHMFYRLYEYLRAAEISVE